VSDSYISAELRRIVVARAQRRCEYCLIFEDDTYLGFQIDHIISEKHGGATTEENLAQACIFCNLKKGSDIGSLDDLGNLVRLFNPRIDEWNDHFRFDGPRIEGITPSGEATSKLLGFNDPPRVMEREGTMSL
jgi:hypothetical protein